MSTPKETDLYAPIKRVLTSQGYEVKSEIAKADVVARKNDTEFIIIELKCRFSLPLFHQAIERLKACEHVYIAAPHLETKAFARSLKANIALARRAGLGLITVRLRDEHVIIHADPGPYASKVNTKKQTKLLRAFERLQGDPNQGGAQSQHVITGYRQDAKRCAAYLREHGPSKGVTVARTLGIPGATRLMRDNHYGWFKRVSQGIYSLSDLKGESAT